MKLLIEEDECLKQLPVEIKCRLISISEYTDKYKDWFKCNINKIRNKLTNCDDIEDQKDTLAELEFAAYLIRSKSLQSLDYEPLGTVKKGPDFRAVLDNGQRVYLEIKRIRRSKAETKRDDFIDLFIDRLKKIPLNFGVSTYFHELKIPGLTEGQIYSSLINKIEHMMQCIEQELNKFNEDSEGEHVISLDKYAEGMKIHVNKLPSHRKDGRVHYTGGLENCPMSGKEFYKFGDIIREKLPQLVDGEQNVILVYADNDSHMFEDLEDAICSISELIEKQDKDFFVKYDGAEKFLRESIKLGGIIVMGKSKKAKLWPNNNAEPRLSDTIKELLGESFELES